MGDDIDVDTVGEMCTFLNGPSNCTVDSVCNYKGQGAYSGVCTSAGGCSNSSYTGVVDSIHYLALDEDGPLVGFFNEFECSDINPKIATLVNDVLCTDVVDSFWWLVGTHIS